MLAESLPVDLGDDQIEISSTELQIAFDLRLARQGGTTSGRDFGNALHLFRTIVEAWADYVRTHDDDEFEMTSESAWSAFLTLTRRLRDPGYDDRSRSDRHSHGRVDRTDER